MTDGQLSSVGTFGRVFENSHRKNISESGGGGLLGNSLLSSARKQ